MLNFAKVYNFSYNPRWKRGRVRQFSSKSGSGKLNSWFVTGLIDAEGCFNLSISKSFKNKN